MKRILTALALVPIVVYVVLFAHSAVFYAVLAAVAFLCYREYDLIAASYGFGAPGPLGYGFGLLLLVWNDEAWHGQAWMVIAAAAAISLALAMREADLSRTLLRSALLTLGVAYIFGCWKFAALLRDSGPHWLMFALMLNWIGDAGAYYVGSRFGKHKMAPRVSPKKSWEGAAASLAFAVARRRRISRVFRGCEPPPCGRRRRDRQHRRPDRRSRRIRHQARRRRQG